MPTLLPNYAVHLLYTGILTNPTILRIVEDHPLYDEDIICQELICLFHLVSSTQRYHALTAPSDLPAAFGIPLRTSLNTIPGRVVERGAPLCWDLHLTYTSGIFPSLTTLVPSS